MEKIKRKTGYKYREMIWVDGSPIKSPLFDRIHDAKEWKAIQLSKRIEGQIHGQSRNLNQKISFSDFADKWLLSKSSQGIAKATYRNYETYLRLRIKPYFQNTLIKSIQRHDVEGLQIQLRKDYNPKGTNMVMMVVKSIFNEAKRDDYISKNPCEFVKSLPEDPPHDVYWTRSEIDQFIKANYDHENIDLFLTAINTGLRRGELAGLCWDRVNFIEKTITVTRTRDRNELKERTKTNVKRVVPMNELTEVTLLNLFKSRKTNQPFVFLDKNDKPIDPHHINHKFAKAQEKAKLVSKIRFHDLRHTFASQFVLNGGDIYSLQKILGHTEIQMTTRYAHLSIDHLHNAMKDFSLGESLIKKQGVLTELSAV